MTYASDKQFDKWFRRSQKAQGLERAGKTEQAIRLYKQNVEEKSEIPLDYERLAVIYSKRKDFNKAIEYCDLALQSPACTNPAQTTARRDFHQRRNKLAIRLKAKQDKHSQ